MSKPGMEHTVPSHIFSITPQRSQDVGVQLSVMAGGNADVLFKKKKGTDCTRKKISPGPERSCLNVREPRY